MTAQNVISIAPKNLPHTSCAGVRGKVRSNSKLPDLNSSAKLRMVIVGTISNRTKKKKKKKPDKLAYPNSRILVSGNTNNMSPFNNRNTANAI